MCVQTENCDFGAMLGKGVNAEVAAWESPLFPGSAVKISGQESILNEADMLASMRHPGIVRVFAVVGKRGVQPSPDEDGYMVMERLGEHIRQYTDGRSVLLHVSSHVCSASQRQPHKVNLKWPLCQLRNVLC